MILRVILYKYLTKIISGGIRPKMNKNRLKPTQRPAKETRLGPRMWAVILCSKRSSSSGHTPSPPSHRRPLGLDDWRQQICSGRSFGAMGSQRLGAPFLLQQEADGNAATLAAIRPRVARYVQCCQVFPSHDWRQTLHIIYRPFELGPLSLQEVGPSDGPTSLPTGGSVRIYHWLSLYSG